MSIGWPRDHPTGTRISSEIKHERPTHLDLRARAELLAYLVSSRLLAKQVTGDWLSPNHVVESTTLWLRTNDAGADVIQRVMPSSRALEAAKQLEKAPLLGVPPQTTTALFCENLRLDFRSAIAREIYQNGTVRLTGRRR